MPDTGVPEAMENAGLPLGSPLVSAGFRSRPVPQSVPIPEVIRVADCVCYVDRAPEAVDLFVTCQSVCQRPGDPQTVDVVLLLRGSGTFDWDDTNSGFSLDGGSTWHALDPDTGDPLQSPLSGLVVDQEYQYTMVLDMADHIDDFLAGQEEVRYLVGFTVS
jgi:hypothetical protein